MKRTQTAIALLAFAAAFSAQAVYAQLLIGGAGSGAVNENGDLEDLLAFEVPDVEFSVAGTVVPRSGGPVRTFDINPPQEDLDEGVIDLTTIVSGVTDARPLLIRNELDFASVTVPEFRLDRVNGTSVTVNDGPNVRGSNAFGFSNNTSTPLDATNGGDNTSAFSNNGTLALRPTSNFNLGGAVGAGSTFTLSYDIAVDVVQGTDDIAFRAELSLVDQQLISVLPGFSSAIPSGDPSLAGGDVSSFTVDTVDDVVTGVTPDTTTRVTQVFTVAEDVNAQFLSLTILFGESGTEGAGIDRGAIDDIELNASLSPVTTLALGDFNDDGDVNAADYTVFRDSVGGPESAISNAGFNNGLVSLSDYLVFAANFDAGNTPRAVSGATAVPEPSAALTLLAGALLLVAKPRRG